MRISGLEYDGIDNTKHCLLCNVHFENEWLCSEAFFSQGKWPDELVSEDRRTLLFSIPSNNTLYKNGSGTRPTDLNGDCSLRDLGKGIYL